MNEESMKSRNDPAGGSDEGPGPSLRSGRRLGLLGRRMWLVLLGGLGLGGVAVATVDATDYYFSTQNFCALTCHVMESTVYQEYKESKHYNTPTGVRATCAQCHVSGRLTFAMWDHFVGTAELWVWATTDLSQPGAFEKLRPAAADRVRMQMLANGARTCRECHDMEGIKPQRVRGQRQHETARQKGTGCIACHYNLVHKEVPPSPAFLKAIEGS